MPGYFTMASTFALVSFLKVRTPIKIPDTLCGKPNTPSDSVMVVQSPTITSVRDACARPGGGFLATFPVNAFVEIAIFTAGA